MANDQLIAYESGGPDFVWASLKERDAIKRSGKATDELFVSPEEYSDIASFYDVISCRDIPQEVVREAFPDHYKAWQWYLSSYPSSSRWYLEALLLTSLSLSEIVKKLGTGISTLAVDVYKRAFFNVSEEKKHNIGWMRQYVWVPSMSHVTNLYYYDFVYKAAAVYGSVYLLDSLLTPEALSPAAVRWIQSLVKDTRTKHMLTSGNIYTNLSADAEIIIQENIVKAWDSVKNTESTTTSITDDAMGKLIEAVGTTAKLLSNTDEVKTETFKSAKYSDADIKL